MSSDPHSEPIPRHTLSAISVSGQLFVKVSDLSIAIEKAIEDAAMQESRFGPSEIAAMLTLQDFIETGFEKIKVVVLTAEAELGINSSPKNSK